LGQIEPPKKYYFDGRIPRLKDLLPQMQGRPGFVYAQICVQNLRRAEDEGWHEVGNTAVYTIRGPKGEVHCKLYAMGRSMPGQSHASGKRQCLVDSDVELGTGLEIQPSPPDLKEETDAEIKADEGQTQREEVEVEEAGGVSPERQSESSDGGSKGKTQKGAS
jgi:hypothetical protein